MIDKLSEKAKDNHEKSETVDEMNKAVESPHTTYPNYLASMHPSMQDIVKDSPTCAATNLAVWINLQSVATQDSSATNSFSQILVIEIALSLVVFSIYGVQVA